MEIAINAMLAARNRHEKHEKIVKIGEGESFINDNFYSRIIMGDTV